MNDTEVALKHCRERWLKAKQQKKKLMMKLMEKIGKRLKKQLYEVK